MTLRNNDRRAPLVLLSLVSLVLVGCSQQPVQLRLGATLPLTGDVASYGKSAQSGIQLAVEQRNAGGGLLGRQVVVDFQDDHNDKAAAVGIFTKFATIDKVPVVFGSAGSGVTLSIAPLASRYQVLLVSPVSSSAKLSTEGGPFFFRTVPSDDLQAQVLAQWVWESGVRRVAIVYTNNAWGKPLADSFAALYGAAGGTVILSEGVAENSSDFRTLITKLANVKDPDAVVSPTYPREGGVFVRQCKELGVNLRLFGGDNWGSPEFLTNAGDAAEGVMFTAPSDSVSARFADFETAYVKRFGPKPDIFAAYAFDAAEAVLRAIATAGSTDPVAVRDALRWERFDGVSGLVSFKPNGDREIEAFVRKRVEHGKAVNAR